MGDSPEWILGLDFWLHSTQILFQRIGVIFMLSNTLLISDISTGKND